MERSYMDTWMEDTLNRQPITRDSIESYQINQLNQLLQYVKKRSKYYAYLPDYVDSLEIMNDIPFTTESMLMEHAHQMLVVSQSEVARIITMDTSGTTGRCKRLYFTEEDQELTKEFFRQGLKEVISKDDNVLICMPVGSEGGIGLLIADALERLGANAILWGESRDFEQMLQVIKSKSITNIIALPIHLISLGRILKYDHQSVLLKSILLSADNCPQWLVDELEELFQCKVFNHYGSRESGLGGAVECSAHMGMHVREKDLIIEIIDKKGNILPDGETGELVITTLHRQAMPLIRYRTNDYTSIIPSVCTCGGITKRIDRVVRGNGYIMQVFDQEVFGMEEVLDYKITKKEAKLILEIIVIKEIEKTKLCSMLQPIADRFYPGIEIQMATEVIRNNKMQSCYQGKRCIL